MEHARSSRTAAPRPSFRASAKRFGVSRMGEELVLGLRRRISAMQLGAEQRECVAELAWYEGVLARRQALPSSSPHRLHVSELFAQLVSLDLHVRRELGSAR